jgi:hypothetical protein
MVRYIVLLLLWWLGCGTCSAQKEAVFKVRKGNGEKDAVTNRVIIDTALPAYTAPVNLGFYGITMSHYKYIGTNLRLKLRIVCTLL